MSSATAAAPRKSVQILVWLFAAIAVLGIAALTNLPGDASTLGASQADTSSSVSTANTAAQSSAVSMDSGSDAASQTALADSIDRPEDESTCTQGAGNTSYLPAMRWSDFSLSVWDDGFIVKANAMLSSFGSFLFFVGDIAWKILFFFLNFGITFQPLCTTASAVNTVVADMGSLAAWFGVPVFIFWFFKQFKNLARMRIGRTVGSLIVLAAMVGGIFYVTDKANEVDGEDNLTVLTTTGTVPWMADTAMGAFATAYTSISGISGVFSGASEDSRAQAFYDTKSGNQASCNAYVNHLYDAYDTSMDDANVSSAQSRVMTQMSGIWEKSYLSSWMRAQFGSGSAGGNFFPAQVACRHLEATIPGDKGGIFNSAHGTDFDHEAQGLDYLMKPLGDTYRLPVDMLWAGCQVVDGKWTVSPGASQAKSDEDFYCAGKDKQGTNTNDLPMSNSSKFSGKTKLVDTLSKDGTILYLDKGEDDVKDKIGYEPDSDAPAEREGFDAETSLNWFRDFSRASIGGNIGDRIGQGLIAAIIGIIYAWTFGPMSMGLTIVGFALVILLMLLPIALLLTAAGQQGGPKLLKLTGAATAVLFLFGLVVSLLSTIISLFSTLVSSIVGSTGFAGQILLAAAPIAAVLLLKKLLQMMGMGNITSLAGALGLTSAMASKAAGGKGDAGVSNAANKGLDAARRAGATGARGLGAGLAAMRKGGPSPLQRLAEGRMGKSALGRKALNGMQAAANKAKKAKDAMGSLARDRAQSAKEEFPQTRAGQLASKMGNSAAGRGLKKAAGVVGGLAKNKTARYGAALGATAGIGTAAGVFGAGAIPLAIAATGALPLGRALSKKVGNKAGALRANRMEKSGRFTKDDEGNLVLKDDEGNDLVGARQLAYARSKGLMAKADTANKRIADRALRNMEPEEKALYTTNFERAQMAGLPTSQAHAAAKKQAVEARNYISKLKTPEEREAAVNTYTKLTLDAVRSRQNGGASAGGMHPGFAGYDNEIAHQIGLETLAGKMGVEKDQIILGNHGLAVPAPVMGDSRLSNGAPNLGSNASIELASHPALYLDRETSQRGKNETDEQYSARITATLAARGLVDEGGNAVDVFKAHGVDVKTTEGNRRVTAWLDGGKDPVLSSIEYSKVKGEDGILKAAQKWANDSNIDHAERQWAYMEEAMNSRASAMQDVANIGSIPVAVKAAKLDLQDKGTPDIARAIGKVDVNMDPIPMQAGTQPVTQKINLKPAVSTDGTEKSLVQDLVTPVTLGETVANMTQRSHHMSSWINEIGDTSSTKPVEDRMRDASRSLQGVQDMEREVDQLVEGLRASSYARAALSVDHFAATNPEAATHSQMKIISQQALDRAKQESGDRENILSRYMSDLFRATSAAQHSSDDDERRKAFRAAADQMSKIEETVKSLYEEEEANAKEMSAAAESAFKQLGDALESKSTSYRGPNRQVIASTSILEEMSQRRKEAFSDMS